MKRFIIILSLMILFTSCSPKSLDRDKENRLPTTGTIENVNDEENNEIDTDNKYEKIANEYTSGVYREDSFEWDLYWIAKSIDRIIIELW